MVEELIAEIEALPVEEYRRCFPILMEKAQRALIILPDCEKYLRQKQALQSIITNIEELRNEHGEQIETWLYRTFNRKKQYALEALNICLQKGKGTYSLNY